MMGHAYLVHPMHVQFDLRLTQLSSRLVGRRSIWQILFPTIQSDYLEES